MTRRRKTNNKPLCITARGETKVIYPTELDARIEVAGHARYNNEHESRYYKCRFHNHYHVTTQELVNS